MDLIFTSSDDILSDIDNIVMSDMSDHNLIVGNVNYRFNLGEQVTNDNHYLTDLIKYNTEDVSTEQWNNFNDYLENIDLELMKVMDVISQVEFLYNALLEASNEALEIKERFKTNTKKKYIPQDVRKLLRKKMKLKKEYGSPKTI